MSGTASYSSPDSSPLPPTAVAIPPESNPSQPTIAAPSFTAEETSPSPPPTAAPEPTPAPQPIAAEEETPQPAPQPEPSPQPTPAPVARTQLQQVTARLVHVQTDRQIELPQNLSVIHIGKPNDRIPPDIDVSGFPNSEIVSRIHSDIRVEGDAYYIEDVGSSNGTYINNLPLLPGNRHRLRPGDRISLGKGDMVTFLFQLF